MAQARVSINNSEDVPTQKENTGFNEFISTAKDKQINEETTASKRQTQDPSSKVSETEQNSFIISTVHMNLQISFASTLILRDKSDVYER